MPVTLRFWHPMFAQGGGQGLVGSLPSQSSPGSLMLLPQTAAQSLSVFALHSGVGQQPSPFTHMF